MIDILIRIRSVKSAYRKSIIMLLKLVLFLESIYIFRSRLRALHILLYLSISNYVKG